MSFHINLELDVNLCVLQSVLRDMYYVDILFSIVRGDIQTSNIPFDTKLGREG